MALAIVLASALVVALAAFGFSYSRLRAAKRSLIQLSESARDADHLWASAVAVVGGVLIGVRPDLTIFEWNPWAEQLFGLTREQVVGQDYLRAAVPFDERDEAADDLSRVMGGRTIEGAERFVTDARGRPRLLSWHMRRLCDTHGVVIGVLLSGVDVTELQASSKRFSLLFELSSDAHVLFDASGTIDCNQAALRLIGAKDKLQLAGVYPLELAPIFQPNGLQSSEAAFMAEAMARRQGHHRFDWTLQSLEGHPVPVEMTLTPVPFEGTEVMLAVWRDLSRRRAAEEAERVARVQMLEVIDAVDSGFAMFDATEHLVLCNAPYRAMLNLDADQLKTGALLHDILGAAFEPRASDNRVSDNRASDDHALEEMLQRHRAPGPAFDVRLGDTTQRVSVQRRHDGGLVVTHTDITVIRSAQYELERSRQLAIDAREHADIANRAKSTFLAAMSREIRTPLHTIIGFTRHLRRTTNGLLRDAERAYLDRIEWNGRHLLALIDNLLDLSKIESGEVQAHRTMVDLEACVRAGLTSEHEQTPASHVEVRVEVPKKLVPFESDPAKLQQLVRHVVNELSSHARLMCHGVEVLIHADDVGYATALELTTANDGGEAASGSRTAFAQDPRCLPLPDDMSFELVMARALCAVLGATLDISTHDDGRRRITVAFRTVGAQKPQSAHAA